MTIFVRLMFMLKKKKKNKIQNGKYTFSGHTQTREENRRNRRKTIMNIVHIVYIRAPKRFALPLINVMHMKNYRNLFSLCMSMDVAARFRFNGGSMKDFYYTQLRLTETNFNHFDSELTEELAIVPRPNRMIFFSFYFSLWIPLFHHPEQQTSISTYIYIT